MCFIIFPAVERWWRFFPKVICTFVPLFACAPQEAEYPDLAYYAHLRDRDRIIKILPALKERGVSLHFDVPENMIGSHEAEEFLKTAEKEGVDVYLWITLSEENGLFINEENIECACEKFTEAGEWNTTQNLGIDGFVFDLEVSYDTTMAFFSGPAGITQVVRDLLDQMNPELYRVNKEKFRQCVELLHIRFHLPVYAVTYFWILDDLLTGTEALQDAFDTPVAGIPWDEVTFMIYTSMVRDWGISAGEGIVASYARDALRFYGERGGIALGIAGREGIGVESTISLDELRREMRCVLEQGIARLRVYSIEGPLSHQDTLLSWFEPSHEEEVSCRLTTFERAMREAFISASENLYTTK